jgi:hypothetical protein
MSWRHQKDWRNHVLPCSEEIMNKFKEAIATSNGYVQLTNPPSGDILYGVARDTNPDFWECMQQGYDECIQAIEVSSQTPERGATVLVFSDVASIEESRQCIWRIPLCDIELASVDRVAPYKAKIEERKRIEKLERDVQDLRRVCVDIQGTISTGFLARDR